MRPLHALPLVPVLLLALGACGSADEPTDSDAISVVASTNVYGDVAQTIGGDAVDVTSIISDPAADPHSYEANARTQLALSKATIVIENGGGYDDFMDTMLSASSNTSATVINAVDVSGKAATAGDELNEHVWYDFPTMSKLADELVDALSTADPDGADAFRANGEAFKSDLETLEGTEKDIAAAHGGEGVAITEPVPLYMLEAAGLKNLTPAEFSEAIEEENDVPPLVLQQTLDLFSDQEVAVLVYNAQTTGPQTDQVITAAENADIPAVPVTETLPEGETYISWMTANLTALSDALS